MPGNGNAMRIGHGYDLHRLRPQPGVGFCLGGFFVHCDYAVIAHSDGDVLCHAVIDSLLGALALGDIGAHFPPSEERWRNANSLEMLRSVYCTQIQTQGYRLVNLDCTVILEKIRLRPLIDDIRSHLLGAFESSEATDINQISVKAKTKEGVDAVGRGEAIEVYASCLLQKR
ncbi:2-C-methyl-D-erythritol 2,4-cyclodiphosphate synthase [Candidatus Haliotispira prima]|uniref:2-C-methyl-D-erythritol 2,4-cyclodiphosphate synthase n=1 Tax=Candidatus Haliotispira prima TaxID=3034016 RepID=A0ABY8MNG6_9SPIO|nr:2-C-methyl-D-erythritol 2,4-cyclodiphosphate synthase [Candidatus Haliotispira prima]